MTTARPFLMFQGGAVAPPEHMEIISAEMRKYQILGQVEMHRGSQHGFIFPERYCYDKQAAERVWERFFAMLERAVASDHSAQR